ncbi:hypothetical protein SEA_PETTERN_42 [Mycobacterium phage PetterN]|uniref:Uncharacterized protein n=4 Tax=Benedictvirus TaxID=2946819 RepID=A0A2P1N252_9CAUD|nr:hypothetical protein AVV06_gp53 [Mycobacterium phage Chadwick]YP_009637944.1 hypothetical protein FGG33_gp56 [Mycobacterium phage Benedict]YP_010060664.1 hypothetical protein KIP48_gp53 [Mycobacterium phage Naca]YP_010060753.1 hypothetical protein KIP49_gp50 [Mycobacterium phage Scorpia]AFN37650.1 hypothetical protein ELTIGER69_40 [Mycobacterium phage ElTiger69]QGJ97088.1 hypothetical protein SEA_PETTERN_42 [Mycobacterium phage PetterN]AEJ93476.1 hypothetical protein BENEDICT_41 [Mycobacte
MRIELNDEDSRFDGEWELKLVGSKSEVLDALSSLAEAL